MKINQIENTSETDIFASLNIRSVAEVFFIIILVILFLKSFVLEFYKVESSSMEPELAKGDIILVSRLAYFFGFPTRIPVIAYNPGLYLRINYSEPKLGDIIVIDAKETVNIPESNFIIKRVTGIPGDTLFLRNTISGEYIYNLKRNAVNKFGRELLIPKFGDYVNIDINNLKFYAQILLNDGKNGKILIDSINQNPLFTKKYKFQNSYYFVTGDNSELSLDSRKFGLVPDKSIIGRAELLIFPRDKSNRFNLL
ncbi:MAG: signal peptidase I [Candidatus Kapabacteria bacterium]|nr:signal peptidase I [Ignavibacteriota bacterium]MCW5884931.1 signal peptidase I [Candidatus Kapabacteria bacterium]